MNNRTLICSYGKNTSVKRIFERLYAMYISNYSEAYVYCALIDLPDGDMYRMAGDILIEEEAKKYLAGLSSKCKGQFFCGIRQRRIGYEKRAYCCENGVAGAIETLWRYVKGKENSLYPTYGLQGLGGVESIYFSACDSEGRISVIEPGGIFRLSALLGESDAVFAAADDTKHKKNQASICSFRESEALYSASALEKMLFSQPTSSIGIGVNGVG